jgi:hypothetical protein
MRSVGSFSAKILKIGVNPYVLLPKRILHSIFKQAGKDKGPIPVQGTFEGKTFTQTLVKYQGAWRLYLNTPMRKNAGKDVGDGVEVSIGFDPRPRDVPMHPKFAKVLAKNVDARASFDKLSPSRKKEILRYLRSMKTEESLDRNIERVIAHLTGKKTDKLYAIMRVKKRD